MLKTMCSIYPENEDSQKFITYLHKNKKEMAAPPGQLTALQALNALRETILG